MSIRLEIRDYSSADIDEVWEWVPESPYEVYFQLEIEIAEVGKEGANLFQVVVATVEGIRHFKKSYPEATHPSFGVVVLDDYSWSGVLDRLASIIRECSKDTWHNSIQCLRKQLIWEYEDRR